VVKLHLPFAVVVLDAAIRAVLMPSLPFAVRIWLAAVELSLLGFCIRNIAAIQVVFFL
jgi:hypothetical protein